MIMGIETYVPCNGCTLCCHKDAVRLLPGDSQNYLIQHHPIILGAVALAHKPNGDCVYLTDKGCSIHYRRPTMCREMDCRNIAISFTKKQLMRMNIKIDVWEQGKKLLNR